MQKSALSFLEATDKLAGTSIKKEFLDTFDEDGDGVVTYENFGKKGIWGTSLHLAGDMISKMGSERFGYLKDRFNIYARMLKYSDISLNADGHDVFREYIEETLSGEVKPLDFRIYMPAGYDNLSGKLMPNVEVTDDPARVLTASFAGGKEIWPEIRL